jgi:hypothetical protein
MSIPPILSAHEIEKIFDSHWRVGFGSASKEDLLIVQSLINHYKPKTFLEVGMASGLSAAFIALFMQAQGGRDLVTIDHDNTFFGDTSKENGFLIDAIYGRGLVNVHKKPFMTSIDLDDIDLSYDMVFVDANHQHPWPTIDLLMAFPRLSAGKIVIFDDLDLFRKQEDGRGIGPKILYDQFDCIIKRRPTPSADIYYLDLSSVAVGRLLEAAASSLFYPWSVKSSIPTRIVNAVVDKLQSRYGNYIANVFRRCAARYNPL